MKMLDYITEVAQGQFMSFAIGMPDANGISKTAINDSMMLYIVASPEGANPTNELDCIFLYTPLISVRGLPDAAYKKLFMEVGKYGLPSAMAPGMRLGYEENSELLWVCQRAIGTVATTPLVAEVTERFVQEALRLQPLLQNFITTLSEEYINAPVTAKTTVTEESYTDSSAHSSSNYDSQQYAEPAANYAQETSYSANNVGNSYGTYTATVNDSEITSLQLMSMGYALRV